MKTPLLYKQLTPRILSPRAMNCKTLLEPRHHDNARTKRFVNSNPYSTALVDSFELISKSREEILGVRNPNLMSAHSRNGSLSNFSFTNCLLVNELSSYKGRRLNNFASGRGDVGRKGWMLSKAVSPETNHTSKATDSREQSVLKETPKDLLNKNNKITLNNHRQQLNSMETLLGKLKKEISERKQRIRKYQQDVRTLESEQANSFEDNNSSKGPAHTQPISQKLLSLSLIHICRCRRIERCRSRWSPYH
eukprot:TRINITY_DN2868_c0_g2_i4.p1 TRINITY_DN2868_c0_g2~~TRINITY_DN2868_c0_g2_i4.p1  ORF type:complete len:250 (-),score=40.36 TRINITY_DN2868_c0_g2_i4:15-764(-)